MLFSSPLFLFLFLPFALLGYYLSTKRFCNYFLLLVSLIFFAWGGVSYTILLLISIVFNYLFGLQIQKRLNSKIAKHWLQAGVTFNLLFLGIFKYTNFIVANINLLLFGLSLKQIPQTFILLPIGISFYTFHSISYLVDIYRNKAIAQKNIADLSLYIAMFPQLIAGPIIRYSDISTQLRGRNHTLLKFGSGVERFIIGLAKKVLIANTLAYVSDSLFATDTGTLTALNAWLGALCYTMQIYYDFSGYSDMAIGLGRMFGFEFKENFNLPYIATSVKEFWRRWHISLSSFFRDYVYIPLGGNKVSVKRTYLNLFIVFFLTGFWHGASWNFVVWGLFHGLFMIIERLGFEKMLEKLWKPLAICYTFLVVLFAWVLFKADTLTHALQYWKAMFTFKLNEEQVDLFLHFMNAQLYIVLSIAVVGALGFFTKLGTVVEKIFKSGSPLINRLSYIYHFSSASIYAVLLFLCTIYLISGTYNPFIYFRF